MDSPDSNDLCSDNCALEIKPVPGMRLGMFATKDIPFGATFFAEVPLVQSMNDKLSIVGSYATLDSYLAERYLTSLTGICYRGLVPFQEKATIPDEDIPLYLKRMRTKSRVEFTPNLRTTAQKGLNKDQEYDKCVSLVQELKQAIAKSREQPSAECFHEVDEKIYEHLNQLFPGKKVDDDGW